MEVRINGYIGSMGYKLFHLLISGIYWGYNPLILTSNRPSKYNLEAAHVFGHYPKEHMAMEFGPGGEFPMPNRQVVDPGSVKRLGVMQSEDTFPKFNIGKLPGPNRKGSSFQASFFR